MRSRISLGVTVWEHLRLALSRPWERPVRGTRDSVVELSVQTPVRIDAAFESHPPVLDVHFDQVGITGHNVEQIRQANPEDAVKILELRFGDFASFDFVLHAIVKRMHFEPSQLDAENPPERGALGIRSLVLGPSGV